MGFRDSRAVWLWLRFSKQLDVDQYVLGFLGSLFPVFEPSFEAYNFQLHRLHRFSEHIHAEHFVNVRVG
jgi:hypothetical protein